LNFAFNHVKYILYHYWEFASGIWPDPKNDENVAVKGLWLKAPFVDACEFAAEVALRVKRCGLDGLLVETIFMRNGTRSEDDVAKEYHIKDVHGRVNRVVRYCADEINIKKDYKAWCRENRNKAWCRK